MVASDSGLGGGWLQNGFPSSHFPPANLSECLGLVVVIGKSLKHFSVSHFFLWMFGKTHVEKVMQVIICLFVCALCDAMWVCSERAVSEFDGAYSQLNFIGLIC